MFRRLLILGAIAALFTIVTVAPASAIAVDKGPNGSPQTVNNPDIAEGNNDGGVNPAHGPFCGVIFAEEGVECAHNGVPGAIPGLTPQGLADTFFGVNLGAWNAYFVSNQNSAICGIWASGGPGFNCE